MNAINDDLHKLDKRLSEKINSVQREAAKMAEQRRNEALGVFAGFLILLNILYFFGLEEFTKNALEEMGEDEIQQHVESAREHLALISTLHEEAGNLVANLEQNNFIRSMEDQSARIAIQEQTTENLEIFSKEFDAIDFEQSDWPDSNGSDTRLIPTQEGICFLTRVSGGFSGNEDKVEINQRMEEGVNYWYLIGSRNSGSVGATAGCLSWPRRVDFEVPPQ